MTRKIIHLDMDAFFASIEQRDNPELRGKPVLVGGRPDSRGVVAAASYEARAFGVFSAMPCSRAARLCPDAVFVYPRFEAYREASNSIHAIFKRYTDQIEPLSLDEAYLDVTARCETTLATELATEIREAIAAETGLTASAGISYNKFLAKIASDMRKPNGQFVVPPERGEEFVAQLPIRKFYGVGKATEARMLALGIETGADLHARSLVELQRHFGNWAQFLYDIARGVDERPVGNSGERKSIGAETTFSRDLSDKHEMLKVLENLSEQVSRTLVKKKLSAETLAVKVRYPDFTTVTRQCKANPSIQTGEDIQPYLRQLLERTDAESRSVRLLGLSVSHLQSREEKRPTQLTLPY